jgi:phosphoglycolate phosphatase/AHBA synthesis associated protein
MPKAVLFDLDGVLVDTYEVWFHLLNDLARRLGYPEVGREAYARSWGQGPEEDVRLFYPRHSVDAIQAEYAKYYGDHLEHLRVMEGADAALRGLALPKAVITNSPSTLARRALEVARLDGHFQAVVASDLVANSKPAPDMVIEACRRLGVAPADALVVGDSRFDEGAAKAAGAAFVWFRGFATLRV